MLTLTAETRRQPVYNLTVEGEHEYFANGILVGNCDTMRYVTMFVDKGAIWTPEQHAAYARGDDLHGPEWGDAEPAAAGNADAVAKEQQYLAEVEALQAAQMRGLVGR